MRTVLEFLDPVLFNPIVFLVRREKRDGIDLSHSGSKTSF